MCRYHPYAASIRSSPRTWPPHAGGRAGRRATGNPSPDGRQRVERLVRHQHTRSPLRPAWNPQPRPPVRTKARRRSASPCLGPLPTTPDPASPELGRHRQAHQRILTAPIRRSPEADAREQPRTHGRSSRHLDDRGRLAARSRLDHSIPAPERRVGDVRDRPRPVAGRSGVGGPRSRTTARRHHRGPLALARS